MRISDWSSDVCSSDLNDRDHRQRARREREQQPHAEEHRDRSEQAGIGEAAGEALVLAGNGRRGRSEEHTSELQSLMRSSYAVFCLKKKTHKHTRLDARTTLKVHTNIIYSQNTV